MTRLLYLIPDLDHGGLARQLCLLASHLPADRFETHVVVLGGPSPWVDELRRAGLDVSLLGWSRPFDLGPFLVLSRLLQAYRPDIIHVWGALALRGLCLAGGPGSARVFLTGLLPALGKPFWLDRWLWGKKSVVIALGENEAQRYRGLGMDASRLAVVWPGVATPVLKEESLPALPGLPEQARVIVAVGPFRPHKGHRDAVWTVDILHYLYPDLHLVLVGDGPERERIRRFRDGIQLTDRVHFAGVCPSVLPWLQRAELVWVLSQGASGVNVALEALAAGKAVVGSSVPALAEIIEDGTTGLLARPGDKPDLARQSRLLLDDAAWRQALADAGAETVRRRFSVAGLVEGCVRLYLNS